MSVSMGPYLRLLRPTDWVKNVLVLAALVFSRQVANAQATGSALVALVAFVLMSAGFYAVNDAVDAPLDRLHPIKRRRPVAAGEVTPRSAWTLGCTLILAGPLVGLAAGGMVSLICGLYIALQAAYNLKLKRVAMVDVVTVAIGFVLRAAAGAAAVGVPLSIWLVITVFFLCLYLGFIKRLSDLTSARQPIGNAGSDANEGATGAWHAPAGYEDVKELTWLLAVAGGATVTAYVAYTLSDHTVSLFGPAAIGFALLTPLVVIAVFRFYRRALQGRSDRPLDALIEDRAIQASTLLFVAGILLALYVPGVGELLNRIFFIRPLVQG